MLAPAAQLPEASTVRAQLLIVHSTLRALGGGEAVGAWAIDVLRDEFEVGLVCPHRPDYAAIDRMYGTSLVRGGFRYLPRRY